MGRPGPGERSQPLPSTRERLALVGLLLATFAMRAALADQPIVENYVGRQVPTAMVARNLDRGRGVLRPQLDTGPFPNLFLVEPPAYAMAAVGLRRATGLALEPAGRLVSALGTVLAAWGFFGLARRREGAAVALLALVAFSACPITIRYGRAFQPDALMLGSMLAALRCWDDHEAGSGRSRLAVGWALLATGLALKITSAYLLLPLIGAILRPPRAWKAALAASALLPALLWYGYAAARIASPEGSAAPADNAAIWLGVLTPTALLRAAPYAHAARFVIVRAFTPVGFALAAWGWCRCRRGLADRLWPIWGASAVAALAVLAGKVHHEYYWLAPAPLAAVGMARALADLGGRGMRGRVAAVLAGAGVLALSCVQSASTWRTPREWASLPEAAAAIRAHVPGGEPVIAPEALLYAADRRGFRLESEPGSAARAAGEWGASLADADDPLALVRLYRSRGARFLADLTPGPAEPSRLALHEAIRSCPEFRVLVDRPGVLLVELGVRPRVTGLRAEHRMERATAARLPP